MKNINEDLLIINPEIIIDHFAGLQVSAAIRWAFLFFVNWQLLGKRLLENCINESKKSGVKRIWLHASEDGEPLYRKMGFINKDSEMELFL